jgi:tRNA dimethylallyltransferase
MLICMDTQTKKPLILIIYGPTGVGKTEVSLSFAKHLPAEIINMDVGQFYTPLSIGSAKPDWRNNPISHHLFDILDEPRDCTVQEYRDLLKQTVKDVISRGNLPILVGGSGFYLRSMLFPPRVQTDKVDIAHFYKSDASFWHELHAIDPQRAAQIDPADTDRIKLALEIWHETGKLPSSFVPEYDPIVDFILLFLERDRDQLNVRINDRVVQMMNDGWLEETEQLLGTPWESFIRRKKIIGYNEIIDFLRGERSEKDYTSMIDIIRNKTRQYAKRQFTFWRKLRREIEQASVSCKNAVNVIETANLTNGDIHLYISKLLPRLKEKI